MDEDRREVIRQKPFILKKLHDLVNGKKGKSGGVK